MKTKSPKKMLRHPMSVKDNFMCLDCFVEFKSKAALENHTCILKLEPAVEVEINSGIEEVLDRNVAAIFTESNEKAYKCRHCGKVFKTFRGCNIHVGRRHLSNNSGDEGSPEKPPITTSNPSTSDSDCKTYPYITPDLFKKKNKRYYCSICPHVCSSLTAYRKHVKGHNTDPTNFIPPISSSSQPLATSSVVAPHSSPTTSFALSSAVVPHTSSTNIILSTANTVTTNLTSHLHECPNCPQKFQKIGSYRRHLRSHLNLHAYKCKHCLISYLTKSQLVAHVEVLHRGEKQYTCSVCNKKFHHSIGFKKHKSEHLSSPPYQCFRCDAVFPSIAKQIIHITNHALSCSFCRKPFANEEELWLHTSAEHKEEKEDASFLSEVSECDDSDSDDELNANFNEVDVESDADSYTSMESDCEESSPKRISIHSPDRESHQTKGHVCFICERRFPKQRSLDLHMKAHKIFSCMACPKFFAHSSELKTHQQEHLQNNSFFYSKAFNDLQLTLQPQLPPTSTVVPSSTAATVSQNTSMDLNDLSTIPEPSSQSSTDFIAWYSGFKDMSKYLKYPIGLELYQSINQIISELASTLYDPEKITQATRNSYVKIYNELTGIIAKNAKHLH